jgi:ribosomal protein S18 acetylase RimI-like enzyme
VPLTIRPALPDELDAVGRLTVDAYVSGGVIDPASPYLSFLSDAVSRASDAQVWVAVDERGVIGTVTYVEPGSPLAEVSGPGEAEIRTLAVDPAAGGQGIGEALTRRMLDLARERGFGAVILSSSTTMHAAHRLYERLGFVRHPERDWTPGRGIQLVTYGLDLGADMAAQATD